MNISIKLQFYVFLTKEGEISLFPKYYQQYGCPMGHGTKEYEDVPDGVVRAFAVVRKEVGANGI